MNDEPRAGWDTVRKRRIEVYCGSGSFQYVRDAANLLVFFGSADEVYPSWLVPGNAVWSLNGDPVLPEGMVGCEHTVHCEHSGEN